jgi:hypothetical protein
VVLRLLRQHQGLCCDADKWLQRDYNVFIPGPGEQFAEQLDMLEFKFGLNSFPRLMSKKSVEQDRVIQHRHVQEDGRILVTEIRVPARRSAASTGQPNGDLSPRNPNVQVITHQPSHNSFRSPYMNIGPRVDPGYVASLERALAQRRASAEADIDMHDVPDGADVRISKGCALLSGKTNNVQEYTAESSEKGHDDDDSSDDEVYGPDEAYQPSEHEPEETWRPTLAEIRSQCLFGGMIRHQEQILQEQYEVRVAANPNVYFPEPDRQQAVAMAHEQLVANAHAVGFFKFQAQKAPSHEDHFAQDGTTANDDVRAQEHPPMNHISAALRGAEVLLFGPNPAGFPSADHEIPDTPTSRSTSRGDEGRSPEGSQQTNTGNHAAAPITNTTGPQKLPTMPNKNGMFGPMVKEFTAGSAPPMSSVSPQRTSRVHSHSAQQQGLRGAPAETTRSTATSHGNNRGHVPNLLPLGSITASVHGTTTTQASGVSPNTLAVCQNFYKQPASARRFERLHGQLPKVDLGIRVDEHNGPQDEHGVTWRDRFPLR